MLDNILELVAPHHCCGCGVRGTILCENCKNDIEFDRPSTCVNCRAVCANDNLCQNCRLKLPYQRAWFVGWRDGALERLLDNLKFERQKSAYRGAAALLANRLPTLPDDIIVVPVPTTATHIRRRGYDHADLIATRLAKSRGLVKIRAIDRQDQADQLGKTRQQRASQAQFAFRPRLQLSGRPTCLLVDDILTTGATARNAARQLLEAGAGEVWLAIVARQPSTKEAIKGKM